jgi:dephospho-CoA kinase
MRVIGLTGGIGSGKTTIAKFLSALGAVIIDADKVGHEALSPGSPVRDGVVAAFDKEILLPDGNIDRRALGKIAFSSPENMAKLNRIMHPWMYDTMKSRIEEFRRRGEKVVVLDAAILLEAGWQSLVDEVWVTKASPEIVIQRLKAREDGLSEADVLARIRRQITNEERVKQADIIINTDCSLAEVEAAVKKLWEDMLKHAASGDS